MFRDRQEAGEALARALAARIGRDPALGGPGDARIVVALPRGGVPVAMEVARALHAPLGLVLVRKIGLPWHSELAAAAVVDGTPPVLVRNEQVIAMSGMSEAQIEDGKAAALAEIARRRALWLPDGIDTDVAGKIAIVVDDGIATGATARAALTALRRQGARGIVLAVPVAPADARAAIGGDADLMLVLETPPDFVAVGAHYRRFDQVSDNEVKRMLEHYRSGAAGKGDKA
ncbi:phosphoribosyltransferase [Halovulum dunhuangense]|uniref:phosphoribosyltransferase n=1 Tax=Halovulum dunhuangense TaxID=1505036 RepID=UPI0031B5DC1F